MNETRTTTRRLGAGLLTAVALTVGASSVAVAAPAPPVAPVCPPEPETSFTDLSPASVHTGNVICAGQIGAMKGGAGGAPADQFVPLGVTSRGQLATLVANLIETYDMTLSDTPADRFTDDDGNVHELSINQLVEVDIIGPELGSGFEFHPNDPATREVIAELMHGTWVAIVGDDLPPGPDAFTDDDGRTFEDETNALAAAGILNGKAPGIFDPTASVTREQIATMFVQLLEVAADALAP